MAAHHRSATVFPCMKAVQQGKLLWRIWEQNSVTCHQGSLTLNESLYVRASSQSCFYSHLRCLKSFPWACCIRAACASNLFCIFTCVLSYLNPSYYSHGWPCQGEICSLTVNGPILTARPPHQQSVLRLSELDSWVWGWIQWRGWWCVWKQSSWGIFANVIQRLSGVIIYQRGVDDTMSICLYLLS